MLFEFYVKIPPNTNDVGPVLIEAVFKRYISSPAWRGSGGCRPTGQKVAGSIPGWGTCLSCQSGPGWGFARGSQLVFLLHSNLSSPLFFPPFPSL